LVDVVTGLCIIKIEPEIYIVFWEDGDSRVDKKKTPPPQYKILTNNHNMYIMCKSLLLLTTFSTNNAHFAVYNA